MSAVTTPLGMGKSTAGRPSVAVSMSEIQIGSALLAPLSGGPPQDRPVRRLELDESSALRARTLDRFVRTDQLRLRGEASGAEKRDGVVDFLF